MQITYNKFEHELNRFLKAYLEDDSFDHLKERLDLPEKKADPISEKINDFYKEQLQIDDNHSKDRIKVDRIITFSEKRLQPEKFCKFLIEVARVCLSEGKLDLANEIFRKANKLSNDEFTKAESLLGLADVFCRRANWSRSLEAINNAKSIFNSINDFRGIAKCENFLGTVYGELGNIPKAKKHLLTSLSLINIDEDLEMAANLFSNLGIVYNIQENPNVSITHLNRALSLYTKLGDNKRAAEVNLNIGLVHFDFGNYDAALISLDMAIETSRKEGFLSVLCLTYLAKAQVLLSLNDLHYASEFADKALEVSHNLDDKLALADIYRVKGIIEKQLNNFIASETYLLNSLRINQSFNNEMNEAETSFELGLLYDKMNDSHSKNSCLESSHKYFKNIGAIAKAERIEELLGFSSAL
jgi:adenylate cyclase